MGKETFPKSECREQMALRRRAGGLERTRGYSITVR